MDGTNPKHIDGRKIYQNPMYSKGLGEEVNMKIRGKGVINPYGFVYWTQKSDSMTQELMLDFVIFFVKHSTIDQEKNTNPVIFLLDSVYVYTIHTSSCIF